MSDPQMTSTSGASKPKAIAGSVVSALKSNRVLAGFLIASIAVCAVLLGVGNLSRNWTVVVQIASAVAGAALGNALRTDIAEHVVRNQARPATRHLFDQVTRLRRMIARGEARQVYVQDLQVSNLPVDHERLVDWLQEINNELSNEITSVASALEDWGDMAADVLEAEFSSYQGRDSRLPSGTDQKQDES